MLEAALVEGLRDAGCDVLRIGAGPTPMLYFAERAIDGVDGGIEVTGSHNPPDHNGFKLQLRGRPFFGPDILGLDALARSAPVAAARRGRIETTDVLPAYVEALLGALRGLDPAALAGLRIGWDAGHGAAGPVIEALVARLPGEHHLLYTSMDGRFPAHHPDPSVAANLADLQRLVGEKRLDCGFAFDGDGDRLGVIDGEGRIIRSDLLLLIYAEDLLQRHPGASVIADVKASQAVFDGLAAMGARPQMARTGHSNIKARMQESGALLGGEMTGHLFFAEAWYGFDDAIHAALRLIAASLRLGRPVAGLHDGLPRPVNTDELRFAIAEDRKAAAMAAVARRLAARGAKAITLDGLRVTTADGWWLLRTSNTEAALVARAEARDAAGLARVLVELDAELAVVGITRA